MNKNIIDEGDELHNFALQQPNIPITELLLIKKKNCNATQISLFFFIPKAEEHIGKKEICKRI